MFYYEDYKFYEPLLRNGRMDIQLSEITKNNWKMHFDCITNIMKDGIETPEVQNSFITIHFTDGLSCDLSIPDYWFNLIMWYLVLVSGKQLEGKHLFFNYKGLQNKHIKQYIDKFFISENLGKFDVIDMNNMIDDTISLFAFIDHFSYYLANTINIEDFITLMKQDPEFRQLIHLEMEDVPFDKVKEVGMEATNRVIEKIMNSDHCLAPFFQAREGVSDKQFKEFAVHMGQKPNGNGGVFPITINKNFISGGMNDIVSFVIESYIGRIAQVIVEGNVGNSGHLARLLGLNNSDTFIHEDINYDCHTKNYQVVFIDNQRTLERLNMRYYRLSPKGMEYCIKSSVDKHLVGKTIYLRSPMTCASAAQGLGICHKCYGELAHINRHINPGKLAAEILSAQITQRMLSAKHLLEAYIKELKWTECFLDYFEIEYNTIKIASGIAPGKLKLKIIVDEIECDEDDDINKSSMYDDYVNTIIIETPKGDIKVCTSELDNLYITAEFKELIYKEMRKGVDEISIKFDKLLDMQLFVIQIHNNDLSRTLDMITSIINKKAITTSFTRDELLQNFITNINEGGLKLNLVHAEIILSNQIRSVEDVLLKPDWTHPGEPCDIYTLKSALDNHPSVTVTLSYEKISKQLCKPLTFRKSAPSHMDLFYTKQPHLFLQGGETVKREHTLDDGGKIIAIERVKK